MLVAVPGLAVQTRHFLLPAVCALLLVSLPTLTYGDGLPSGLQCGVTEPASEEVYPGEVGCGDDANEYVVRFLFVTFPNVLDTLEVQEQPLPTFADSVVADIVDYIRFISVDTVSLDARIEKRSGADSVYYWVTDLDSNDLCLSTTWATIDSLPPMGWNDNVDLVVYCLADYLCDQPMQPFTWGHICGSTPPTDTRTTIFSFSRALSVSSSLQPGNRSRVTILRRYWFTKWVIHFISTPVTFQMVPTATTKVVTAATSPVSAR